MSFGAWVQRNLITADAIYGLILYSALVAAVSDDSSDALEVLIFAEISLIIFWGAHVFAGTIANHGADVPLRTAVDRSIKHSVGMLIASILPSVPLIFGAFHLVSSDDAVSYALLVSMVILGILGYNALAQRKARAIVRILGGIGTAMFGLLIILLNIAVH
jgi:hypothetical protein